MIKNRILFVLASLLILTNMQAFAKGADLTDPAAIAIPAGMKAETVKNAINGALSESGWIKERDISQKPMAILAAYHIRTHTIILKIEHIQNTVKFLYSSSENMKYKKKKDKQYIHPNYNVWTQQLADKIEANIGLGNKYVPGAASATSGNSTNSNPAPKQAFSAFSKFKLESTTLATAYTKHQGNVRTKENLQHELTLKLAPTLERWNQRSGTGRTLIITPHIVAVKFIGSGARFWVGAMAGRSWIYVKVTYSDQASGAVIAEPELYRVAHTANGWTLAKNDYQMVTDMAADIAQFTENNYATAIGGGTLPPEKIKQSVVK